MGTGRPVSHPFASLSGSSMPKAAWFQNITKMPSIVIRSSPTARQVASAAPAGPTAGRPDPGCSRRLVG